MEEEGGWGVPGEPVRAAARSSQRAAAAGESSGKEALQTLPREKGREAEGALGMEERD